MNTEEFINSKERTERPIAKKVGGFFSNVWDFTKKNWYLFVIYAIVFALLWFSSPSFVSNYCKIQLKEGLVDRNCLDYKRLILWSGFITIMIFTVYALYKILNFNASLSKIISKKLEG